METIVFGYLLNEYDLKKSCPNEDKQSQGQVGELICF